MSFERLYLSLGWVFLTNLRKTEKKNSQQVRFFFGCSEPVNLVIIFEKSSLKGLQRLTENLLKDYDFILGYGKVKKMYESEINCFLSEV